METIDQAAGLCNVLVEEKGRGGRAFSTKLSIVRGIFFNPFIQQERWNTINRSITWRPTDIVISTYPKCGTTWVEQVVLLLLNGGRAESLDPLHKNAVNCAVRDGSPINAASGKLWPEACLYESMPEIGSCHLGGKGEFAPMTLAEFGELPSPRVVKTHAPCHMFPGLRPSSEFPEGVKIVHVTRNPKDAAVSSYYHAFNPFKQGWPFDAWLKVWVEGLVPSGSFFAYEQGWIAAARCYPEQVLCLYFEDVKAAPLEQVARVAAHLGVPTDQALLERVTEQSTFHQMKNAVSTQAKAIEAKGGKAWGAVGHMRKGEIGDWRNHFDGQLSSEFDEIFQMRMGGAGMTYKLGEGDLLTA